MPCQDRRGSNPCLRSPLPKFAGRQEGEPVLSPGGFVAMAKFIMEWNRRSLRRLKIEPSTIFYTFILAFLVVVVVYPLALLVFNSFVINLSGGKEYYGLENWIMAWSQPGIVTSLINTFTRAIVTIFISFPIGILFAWLLTRTDIPGKEFLDFFMWVAFFLPSLPVLMG